MENKNKREKLKLYKSIGGRLLSKRKELHYTQERMAELLGVSTGFYGMMERGEKAPSIERLILLYEKLGIDITYLLTGNEGDEKLVSYLSKCPYEKQHQLKQLMKYALNLVETK